VEVEHICLRYVFLLWIYVEKFIEYGKTVMQERKPQNIDRLKQLTLNHSFIHGSSER